MMLAYACAALAVLAFFVLLQAFGVVNHARQATSASRAAMSALADPATSDDEKEPAAQSASARLFGHFLHIVLRSAAALALPTLALYAADRVGLISFDAATAVMMSWPFIAATCVVAVLALMLRKPRAP